MELEKLLLAEKSKLKEWTEGKASAYLKQQIQDLKGTIDDK